MEVHSYNHEGIYGEYTQDFVYHTDFLVHNIFHEVALAYLDQ